MRTYTNLDFRLCDATHMQDCHESKCNSPHKLNALIFPHSVHKNVIQITRIVFRLKHVSVNNNVADGDTSIAYTLNVNCMPRVKKKKKLKPSFLE